MSNFNNDFKEETPVVEEATEAAVEETVVEEVPEATIAPVEVVEVEKAEKPKKEKVAKAADSETVALFSERNLAWEGVGTLKAGYNIVSKEEANGWLSGNLKVRLASPEEIAARVNA